MSVINGAPANADTFNNAFLSKITDNVITSSINMNDGDSAQIVNAQTQINLNKDNISSLVTSTGSDSLRITALEGDVTSLNSDLIVHSLSSSAHAQLDGLSLRDPVRLDMKKDSYANLVTYAATATNGQLCWSIDTKKSYVVKDATLVEVGSGSGGGGSLLTILSMSLEEDVTGLIGEAGCTITSNTTLPLHGVADGLITISSGDQSTKKVYVDTFTMPIEFRASIVTLSFGCLTSAGYTDGKVGVYLYDVTNSALIYPSDQRLMASSLAGIRTYQFQTSADGTQYRIYFKVDTTETTACTIQIDDIELGIKPVVRGLAGWKQYDLTVSGTNWTTERAVATPYKTLNNVWRIAFNIEGTTTGTKTSQSITLSGVTFKSGSIYQSVTAQVAASGAAGNYGALTAYTGVGDVFCNHPSYADPSYRFSGDVELNSMPTFAQDYSNMLLSEDAGNRRIAFYGKGNAGQTLTADVTDCPFIMVEDTSGSWSGSIFTSPETGDYKYNGGIYSGATNCYIGTYKNGAVYEYSNLSTTSDAAHLFNGKIRLLRNETLSFRPNAGMTLSNVATAHYLSITKDSSPQTIATSEKIYASYWVSSNFASDTTTPINFDSKEIDTHGCVTTSPTAWKFTSKSTRVYTVKFRVQGSSGAAYARIYKNGSFYKEIGFYSATGDLTTSADISLNFGEYLDIRPSGSSTVVGNAALATNGTTWISIKAE